MHSSSLFLKDVAGFLGSYYTGLAIMNAVAAIILWQAGTIPSPLYAQLGPRVAPYIVGGGLAVVRMRVFVDRLCIDEQITTMLRPAGDRGGHVGRQQEGDAGQRAGRGVGGGRGSGVRVVHDGFSRSISRSPPSYGTVWWHER